MACWASKRQEQAHHGQSRSGPKCGLGRDAELALRSPSNYGRTWPFKSLPCSQVSLVLPAQRDTPTKTDQTESFGTCIVDAFNSLGKSLFSFVFASSAQVRCNVARRHGLSAAGQNGDTIGLNSSACKVASVGEGASEGRHDLGCQARATLNVLSAYFMRHVMSGTKGGLASRTWSV